MLKVFTLAAVIAVSSAGCYDDVQYPFAAKPACDAEKLVACATTCMVEAGDDAAAATKCGADATATVEDCIAKEVATGSTQFKSVEYCNDCKGSSGLTLDICMKDYVTALDNYKDAKKKADKKSNSERKKMKKKEDKLRNEVY